MKNIFLSPQGNFFSNSLMNKVFFTFALAFLVTAFPQLVWADSATSLGETMCSVSHNLAPFEKLFVGLAYITGAILIGSGLFQLAYYTDVMATGRQYGISRPKGYLVAGSALLALPAFLKWMVNSVFNQSFNADLGGGLSGCFAPVGAAGTNYGVGGEVGLDGLMINLIYNIKSPMVFMLSVISILLGIFMVARGLIKGSKFGQDGKATVPNIIANIVIGTILYTVGTSLNTIMATVFGDSTIWNSSVVTSAIASDFGSGTEPFQQAVYAALTFFQLVGFIAFIRGWLIIRDAVEGGGGQNKTVAQGLVHIFGGVLAVNIYRFLDVMDQSFGTGFI